jgi:hypothetical protein
VGRLRGVAVLMAKERERSDSPETTPNCCRNSRRKGQPCPNFPQVRNLTQVKFSRCAKVHTLTMIYLIRGPRSARLRHVPWYEGAE